MTRLVNVTCQDMAVNMRHVHDKVNWHMCQDTVTHMKHAHDKAGNCYTCQDVVVMYMGHVHDESGYTAVMYMTLETAIHVHMHIGCVMHMEHGQEKAGNCHRPGWGHVYQDMPTMRLLVVNLGLYPSKSHILWPAPHSPPGPISSLR